MGLEQRNKSKTTYTAWAAIMLDCISWGTKEQGVPMGFAHHEPIRRHHLRSHDSHTGFPQSDVRAS